MKGGLCFIFQWERTGGRERETSGRERQRRRKRGGGEWAIYECWESWGGRRREKKRTARLQVWCGRFSDSYNSPAYRISSTQVVLKLCRRAAALSSPELWQVDLLVLKFVQITRHSWQTVKVSALQCSCRGLFCFSLFFCRDKIFYYYYLFSPTPNKIAVQAGETVSHLILLIQMFLTLDGNQEWHKSRKSIFDWD